MVAASIKIGPPDQLLIYAKKSRWKLSKNNPRLFFFILFIHNDVGVKRYFDPFDTRLLRALHSRNPFQLVYLYSTTERSFLARNTSIYDKKMTFVTFLSFSSIQRFYNILLLLSQIRSHKRRQRFPLCRQCIRRTALYFSDKIRIKAL